MLQRLLVLLVLAGTVACADSAGSDNGNYPDAGASSDGSTCGTAITFDPMEPVSASALAPIRAQVNVVGSPGVFTYSWTVNRQGSAIPFTMEASDNSQIGFIADVAGPYRVTVDISGPVSGCAYAEGTINVEAPGANVDVYRLRAVPPNNAAPPQESIIQVRGGADYVRAISLDPGISASLAVQQSGTGAGVPAYVKLMPVGAPNAFTELFTAANGTFSAKLLGQMHMALVIPTSTSLAPALVAWMPTSTSLVVGAGTLVTGSVLGPSGAALAGAKVQLTSGGVPSTTATTAADGSFSLRSSFAAGAMITVKVTPPAASGLPRLEALGTFDLGSAMQITYASSLATCDLSNTQVKRSTVNQAGATVTIVGALAATAGTVVAGVTANAVGNVRIAATADGTGRLPSVLVPRAPLSAVVELGTNDFAVDAIDTTSCPTITIDAPALVTRTGTAKDAASTALQGVRVEATPIGPLAIAGAQTVTAMTGAAGQFSIALASGGRYDVRFVDPLARAARLESPDVAPADVPMNPVLPEALVISGKVSVAGSTQPVPSTSIQLLCATCTGLDAARPVAEDATDSLSDYRIAVPDPGTM